MEIAGRGKGEEGGTWARADLKALQQVMLIAGVAASQTDHSCSEAAGAVSDSESTAAYGMLRFCTRS